MSSISFWRKTGALRFGVAEQKIGFCKIEKAHPVEMGLMVGYAFL
jgi:hypothetical protein